MLTTIETEIDVDGKIKLLEPLSVTKKSRIIITLIDNLNMTEQNLIKPQSYDKTGWKDEVSLRAAFAEIEDEEKELANCRLQQCL